MSKLAFHIKFCFYILLCCSSFVAPETPDEQEAAEFFGDPDTVEDELEYILSEGSRASSTDYEAQEIALKSPSEILILRGYKVEKHTVTTKDGYKIDVVRVINPKLDPDELKRPMIFNHGLLECSTIWLINSRDVKAEKLGERCSKNASNITTNSSSHMNGPMMMANHAYDVWLMSMRGTDYSLGHDKLQSSDSRFWDFSLDDYALHDVPAVIDYVQKRTGKSKVAYAGHSAGTFAIFALLATRPEYADRVEPVFAVAPVAYFHRVKSVARILYLASLHFRNQGPFPKNAAQLRKLSDASCNQFGLGLKKLFCEMLRRLVAGKGQHWPRGYYSHLPFTSSEKTVRHFGQLTSSKRFQRYDYGPSGNMQAYGTRTVPTYNIKNITSKSLVLISALDDALSNRDDVEQFQRELPNPVFRHIQISSGFNHFDLITSQDARSLVFEPMLQIIEKFENQSSCDTTRNDSPPSTTPPPGLTQSQQTTTTERPAITTSPDRPQDDYDDEPMTSTTSTKRPKKIKEKNRKKKKKKSRRKKKRSTKMPKLKKRARRTTKKVDLDED